MARVLSRDQFSDLGAVASDPSRSAVAAIRAVPRRLLSKLGSSSSEEAAGSAVPFMFVRAMRQRDAAALQSLTAPKFEFVQRSPGGDLSLRGEEGHAALVRIAEETFSRRYV